MERTEMLQAAKPILFNTEMVRAILEGRKTVTRRVVKLPSYVEKQGNGLYTLGAEGTYYYDQHLENIEAYLKKPYQVSNVLYVRETWNWLPCFECGRDTWANPCQNGIFNVKYGNCGCYVFRADVHNADAGNLNWKPSIHMPAEAARIFLRITDVRLERLQEITEVQAQAEGCNSGMLTGPCTARGQFENLWNSTIKKSDIDRYGWEANPYVWVIEFEKLEVE